MKLFCFCGYCQEVMTGYGGTDKSDKAYHYGSVNSFAQIGLQSLG